MTPILNLLSYPRGIVMTIFAGLYTLLLSAILLICLLFTKSQRFVDLYIMYVWARPLLWLAGARVEVRGAENVTAGRKGFLILFNHCSLMDIPVLFGYFPRSFRFGAKIELFSIPFFGRAMKRSGVLPIDRRNRNKVMKIYEQAVERVNNGESFALAPEGTRQTQPELGPFKRGPFEFAVNAQMDLVPAVIAGAYDLMPKKALLLNVGKWRRYVILEILPPVSTAGLGLDAIERLQAQIHADMKATLDRLNAELAQQ